MKSNNIVRAVLLIGGVCLYTALSSCNISKKVAKQNEAINKLKQSFEKEKEEVCNKCVNEWVNNNPREVLPAFNLDSMCKMLQRVRYIHDTINPETVTDIDCIPNVVNNTVAVPYLDMREIKRWKDSAYYYKSLCAYKDNELLKERIEQEKNISLIEKKGKEKSIFKTPNWVWWILGVLILYHTFIWLIKNKS